MTGKKLKKLPASATWIKEARVQLDLNRTELASYLGVCESTVYQWEKRGIPTQGYAAKNVQAAIESLLEKQDKAIKKITADAAKENPIPWEEAKKGMDI